MVVGPPVSGQVGFAGRCAVGGVAGQSPAAPDTATIRRMEEGLGRRLRVEESTRRIAPFATSFVRLDEKAGERRSISLRWSGRLFVTGNGTVRIPWVGRSTKLFRI